MWPLVSSVILLTRWSKTRSRSPSGTRPNASGSTQEVCEPLSYWPLSALKNFSLKAALSFSRQVGEALRRPPALPSSVA